jgi:hypothetical protein
MLYRDKKVVGVFVRFSCAASLNTVPYVDSEMSQWDGRLIFAGEGTIVEYEGSVHSFVQQEG